MPDTPTILEADLEGLDTGSCLGNLQVGPAFGSTDALTQTSLPQQQHQVAQITGPVLQQQVQVQEPAALPFGLKSSADSSYDDGDDDKQAEADDWLNVCSPAAAEGQQRRGPEGLRSLSGHMPAWLWPSSRLAVRGLTTDDIMRRISSNRDPAALQHMCRGLLCERNDWRFRATQVGPHLGFSLEGPVSPAWKAPLYHEDRDPVLFPLHCSTGHTYQTLLSPSDPDYAMHAIQPTAWAC